LWKKTHKCYFVAATKTEEIQYLPTFLPYVIHHSFVDLFGFFKILCLMVI